MNEDAYVYYGKLVVKMKLISGESWNENLGEIIATPLVAQDSDAKVAFATQVDTFARAVTNLTQGNYDDSEVTVILGITEILAD